MSNGPDIASLIAAHLQPGAGLHQAPPPGPPAPQGNLGPAPGGPAPGGGGQPVALIEQMIHAGMQYIQLERDPERKATMSKVLQTLHQYAADEQKNQDAALGTSPAMKAMRNQVRG